MLIHGNLQDISQKNYFIFMSLEINLNLEDFSETFWTELIELNHLVLEEVRKSYRKINVSIKSCFFDQVLKKL